MSKLLKFYFQPLWIVGFSVVAIAVLENASRNGPIFDTSEKNVTVIAGQIAKLECEVENIGERQIVWMSPKKALISKGEKRVIDDTRMSIERTRVPEWNLHIRDVKYEDRGTYVCNLNTKPMMRKYVNLIVRAAPDINEELSSGDQIVREGSTVELHCNASGVPPPTIQWYRKTTLGDTDKETKELLGTPGDILIIHNITRYCDGTYECIADNGVAERASKEIKISVEFPPEVQLLNMKIGQRQGQETILGCVVSASPLKEVYWAKDGREINGLVGEDKVHYYERLYRNTKYTVDINLNVVNIMKEHYGNYSCVAKNRLGRDSQTMLLYEYHIPKVTTTVSPNISSHKPIGYTFPAPGLHKGTRSENGATDRRTSLILCFMTWVICLLVTNQSTCS